MTRIFAALVGIAVLSTGFLVVAGQNISASGAPQTSQPMAGQGLQTVTLKVGKMDCASCVYILQRTLEGVEGVASAKVSYGKSTAIVKYDPAKCQVAQLTAATASIGFPSTVLQ